jgi:hypothetical protein
VRTTRVRAHRFIVGSHSRLCSSVANSRKYKYSNRVPLFELNNDIDIFLAMFKFKLPGTYHYSFVVEDYLSVIARDQEGHEIGQTPVLFCYDFPTSLATK